MISLTLEDASDLWCLKRVIEPGDLISGETTRVMKREGEYSRPDKGERVKVRVVLRVERANLDNSLERLRISGKIVDMPEDIITRGSFHSMIATQNYSLSLQKNHWNEMYLRILKDGTKTTERFIIVAMDRREAGIGVVQGTHLQVLPTVESGLAGKHYDSEGRSPHSYYDKVAQIIQSVHKPCAKIFVTGSGHTKNSFISFLSSQSKNMTDLLRIIEGVDVAGEDGVYMALRSPQLRRYIEDSKLAQATNILERAIKKIDDGDKRVAFTFNEVKEASRLGAVDSVVISDKVFDQSVDEDDIAELLNFVEEFRGKSYMIDSSTEVSSQVMALGGIVALLRFSSRAA
ncbi:MAG: mRNA surveillance protein pelota [Nitrososphaerales archaeon]|nr:mRNA surveillance protein pelota [Nitrososphaerales archaeon]